MALISRLRPKEEEEESVFVSMTDLMISILFIVMIVMAFFAKSARESDPEIRVLQEQIVILQQENEALRVELVDLETQLVKRLEMTRLVPALRTENKYLREELARLSLENDALLLKIERISKELAELTKENIDLRIFIRNLEKELAVLRAELERLKQQIEIDPLETALNGIAKDRVTLLSSMRDRLVRAGIKVIVDEVSGVIRFGEDTINFASGSPTPSPQSIENVHKIAEILTEEMRCFTMGAYSQIAKHCNPNGSVIETVQIEGHTDTDGSQLSNLTLSTQRAAAIYEEIISHEPLLESYFNANFLLAENMSTTEPGQQVLSVSGYGETRLINFDSSMQAKRANRRIDIRFIMTTPKNIEEVDQLKSVIRAALQN